MNIDENVKKIEEIIGKKSGQISKLDLEKFFFKKRDLLKNKSFYLSGMKNFLIDMADPGLGWNYDNEFLSQQNPTCIFLIKKHLTNFLN